MTQHNPGYQLESTPLRRRDGSLDMAAYLQRSRVERSQMLRSIWRALFAPTAKTDLPGAQANPCLRT